MLHEHIFPCCELIGPSIVEQLFSEPEEDLSQLRPKYKKVYFDDVIRHKCDLFNLSAISDNLIIREPLRFRVPAYIGYRFDNGTMHELSVEAEVFKNRNAISIADTMAKTFFRSFPFAWWRTLETGDKQTKNFQNESRSIDYSLLPPKYFRNQPPESQFIVQAIDHNAYGTDDDGWFAFGSGASHNAAIIDTFLKLAINA